jgi:hypothetical protein
MADVQNSEGGAKLAPVNVELCLLIDLKKSNNIQ